MTGTPVDTAGIMKRREPVWGLGIRTDLLHVSTYHDVASRVQIKILFSQISLSVSYCFYLGLLELSKTKEEIAMPC